MTKETARIDVTFDNNTGVPFYFSITNEEEIKQIMHIIFTGVLKKQSKEINDGNHTSIKIIQGEKTYSMHVTNIKSRKYYYYFEYSELQHKIGEFAREAGAYMVSQIAERLDIDVKEFVYKLKTKQLFGREHLRILIETMGASAACFAIFFPTFELRQQIYFEVFGKELPLQENRQRRWKKN